EPRDPVAGCARHEAARFYGRVRRAFHHQGVRISLAARAVGGLALVALPFLTARRVRSARNGVSSGRMAVTPQADRQRGGGDGRQHDLPDKEPCVAILERMMLIRRFEERAGEMYAKAKIGGFLHLFIGEEATIVGAVNALRETDYLMSTYREHGQALA